MWTFSPDGATHETEDYQVDLWAVTALELTLTPDISGGDARASLAGAPRVVNRLDWSRCLKIPWLIAAFRVGVRRELFLERIDRSVQTDGREFFLVGASDPSPRCAAGGSRAP